MAELVPSDFVARVASRLAARRVEKESVHIPRPTYDPLYETAAVVSWFDPHKLSLPDDMYAQERTDKLLADSIQTVDPDGVRRWTISPDVRVKVLAQLRGSGRVREVLEATQERPNDEVQRALERCLRGNQMPLETQTLEELGATFQVCEWLRHAGFEGLPDKESIQQRIDWLTLLEPFEHLAAKYFRGRVRELQELRDYVGVLPPGSVYAATVRFVEHVFNFKDKPPLVIYGPGGVGKSTLVARFILEHARALEQDRFPFAYLDFDRPDLESQEPLTLLAEAVRQLGIEYPQARERCEQIRHGWLNVLANAKPATAPGLRSNEGTRALRAAVRDFSTLIDSLGAEDRPVLFVLDTFEEVQYRSEEHVRAIWRMLEELQAAVTRLRVVVAGRANIRGRKTRELQLMGLDEEAAIGYLEARGIAERQVAQRLADQLGGSPLSLQLAAELFQREGFDERGRLNVETRNFFFSRMDDAIIQRQLYMRILDHVHDEEVRKLAHPGLLLRRLTPELILKVLAEPCDLRISTLEEAQSLFDKLQREVSLVTIAPDGALEHRQDLRRLILELIETDAPEKTRTIHQSAVQYYEQQPLSPQSRAEEIYHRLALGQKLAVIRKRWLKGVELYLANALPEFEGARLAFLSARLKVEVTPETLQAAELEDWESIVARKAQELLSQERPQEALELLAARNQRTDRSPLFSLAAKALVRVGRGSDSINVLMDGIIRASAAHDRRLELSLTLQTAESIIALGQTQHAATIVKRMVDLDRQRLQISDRLNLFAHLSVLSRLDPSLNSPPYESSLREIFDVVSDSALVRRPSVARWSTLSFGGEDLSRLSRVLRLTGLPRVHDRLLRHLAAELTSVDVAISHSEGKDPGMLAGALILPSYDSLTDTWSRFVLNERKKKVAQVLCHLLDKYALYVTPRLIEAVINIMRHSLGLDLTDQTETFTERDLPRQHTQFLKLTPELRERLVNALIAAFSVSDLRQLLRIRFDRILESITGPDAPFIVMVHQIVRTAEMEGWLIDLVAKAHESRPGNADLAEIAQLLGLLTLSSATIPSPIISLQEPWVNPVIWREWLGTIEAQVCRIEIGGRGVGTGFLVGIDLVLTADFVLEQLYSQRIAPGELKVRFDYKVDQSGRAITAGTVFGLDKNWLVARREYGTDPDQLGYTILRVVNSPGAQPIGDPNAEASAALRRWIVMPEQTSPVQPGVGLMMVHHPEAGPLKLTVDQKAVVSLSRNNSVVYYTLNSAPGSSGAPCFNFDLELVAFHIGHGPYADSAAPKGAGVGVLMTAVLRDLKELGLGDLLGARFV